MHPIEHYYWCMTWRRAAATAMAVRLYAVDHQSNWPQDLSVLVPKYLTKLPADPFAPGAQSLKYLAVAPRRQFTASERMASTSRRPQRFNARWNVRSISFSRCRVSIGKRTGSGRTPSAATDVEFQEAHGHAGIVH